MKVDLEANITLHCSLVHTCSCCLGFIVTPTWILMDSLTTAKFVFLTPLSWRMGPFFFKQLVITCVCVDIYRSTEKRHVQNYISVSSFVCVEFEYHSCFLHFILLLPGWSPWLRCGFRLQTPLKLINLGFVKIIWAHGRIFGLWTSNLVRVCPIASPQLVTKLWLS